MKKADIKIDFETKTENKKNEDEEKEVLSTLNKKNCIPRPPYKI